MKFLRGDFTSKVLLRTNCNPHIKQDIETPRDITHLEEENRTVINTLSNDMARERDN